MIEVETEYHISRSDLNAKPDYKCLGTCKKVWWKDDVEPAPFGAQLYCQKCGGVLSSARESLDYKITKIEPGEKVFPGSDIDVKHSSNLLEQFEHLEKTYGWK